MLRRLSRDRYLSDAELAAFMTAVRERHHVHQPRDHAFFALLANTGMRPSEALRLSVGDFHLRAHPPWVTITRLKKQKPERDDLVLPDALAALLDGYLATLVTDRPFPITPRSAERIFHHYTKRAGIRRTRLYILRHTAATRIYRATRDIKVVQQILGHQHPDTSTIYAHVPRELLATLAREMPATT